MSQQPPSVGENFYLYPLDTNINRFAYNFNFLNIKAAEPSLGIPNSNTYADANVTYYFPIIAIANSYKDSRRFSNSNSTLTYYNDNVGIRTSTPGYPLTVNGTISGTVNIIIGLNNSASNFYSSVLGGSGNNVYSGYSTIANGLNNAVSGDRSFIGSGKNNSVNGTNSFIGNGVSNIINANNGYIAGGFYNQIQAPNGIITGGTQNLILGNASIINGGSNNEIDAASSAILAGNGNVIPDGADFSAIVGGQNNAAAQPYSSVLGGINNNNSGIQSVIGGGAYNQIVGTSSNILGGNSNIITSDNSNIVGGSSNNINAVYAFVGSGSGNITIGNYSNIVGGFNNNVSGDYSSILGGQNNNDNGNTNTFILGSNIIASQPDTTYVESLSSANNTYTSNLSSNTIYSNYIGVSTTNPNYPLDVRGDINIGDPNLPADGTWGNKLWFSGTGSDDTFAANNTDPIYLYRVNSDTDNSELRINIGDNSFIPQDSFVVGATDYTTQNAWYDWMRVQSLVTTVASSLSTPNINTFNLGIGDFTTTPQVSTVVLDIRGDINIGSPTLSSIGEGNKIFFSTNGLLGGADNNSDQVYIRRVNTDYNKTTLEFVNGDDGNALDNPENADSFVFRGGEATYWMDVQNGLTTFNDLVSAPRIITNSLTSGKISATNIQTGIANISSAYINTESVSSSYINNLYVSSYAEFLSNVKMDQNLTVYGKICAVSGLFYTATNFLTSAAIKVDNFAAGPALKITEEVGATDIAQFISSQGTQVLHVGNTPILPRDGTTGYVGINTSTPNTELTVVGNISTNNSLFATYLYTNTLTANYISTPGGNSDQWNQAYTGSNRLSGLLLSVYGTVSTLSGIHWESVYNTVSSISGNWNSVYGTVSSLSGNWNSSYNTLTSLSGNWNSAYNTVSSLSGKWNSVYNTVSSLSGNWNSVYNTVSSLSGNWQSNYNTVSSLSGNWQSVYGTVSSLSSKWGQATSWVNSNSSNAIFSTVSATSVSANYYYGDGSNLTNVSAKSLAPDVTVQNSLSAPMISAGYFYGNGKYLSGIVPSVFPADLSISNSITVPYLYINQYIDANGYTDGEWTSTFLTVSELSGNWNSVYNTVSSLSGNWNSVYNTVTSLSGNWNSVYNTVSSISGYLVNGYNTLSSLSGNWQSVYGTVSSLSGNWGSTFNTVTALSGNWQSVYNTVTSLSGNWNSVYGTVSSLSGNWNSSYNTLTSLSGNWNSAYNTLTSLSGNWNSVYNTVSSISGNFVNWNSVYNTVSSLSGNWNQATSWVNSNSANATFSTISATSVSALSVSANSLSANLIFGNYFYGDGSNLTNVSASKLAPIITANTSISAPMISAAYFYGNGSQLSNVVASVFPTNLTITNSISAPAISAVTFYTNSYNSNQWNSAYLTVSSLSGNWQTAYNVATALPTTLSNYLPLSGGTITGNLNLNGNLFISGSSSYIDSVNTVLGDSLIYFASGNNANLNDLGFVGHFTQGPIGYQHTGLVRQSGQSSPGTWTLFSGLTSEPLTASNISWNDPYFALDTLNANVSAQSLTAANIVSNVITVFGSISATGSITGSSLTSTAGVPLKKNIPFTGTGGNSITNTNTLGTSFICITVYDNAGNVVYPDINVTAQNIKLTFSQNIPNTVTYTVVIVG
jgi:hypothetical protein